jgi:hypothetical protein
MLIVAKQLEDNDGIQEYENNLLAILSNLDLNDKKYFQTISDLAKNHGLKELLKEVKKREATKTEQLIKKELLNQQAVNEALSQELIQTTFINQPQAFPWVPPSLFGILAPTQKPTKKS